MTENSILSIVVPVYNGEKYIDRCVEAVVRDYRPGVELLLVDDGSEDGSLGKCNDWQSVHGWIRVLHHENWGVSYTRNRGLQEAKGKYIWFVDVDDVILQDSITSILKIVGQEEPDILLFGYRSKLARKQLNEFDTNPAEQGRYLIEKDAADFFWELLGKNLIHNIGNKVYLTKMLKENDLDFETGLAIYEDALFCVNAMRTAVSLSVYPGTWYCYHLEANGQSLNHIYRKNYFTGVVLLYESIAGLLKRKDKQYYLEFLRSISGVIENEFRQRGFGYIKFRRFVQWILAEDPVEQALERVGEETQLDKKWRFLLYKKYLTCYFCFKYEYKKGKILESKLANTMFDLAYDFYKKCRVIKRKGNNGN